MSFGRACPVSLEPAEAQRAHDERGRYWLVIVWNLEKPRTPEFVVIPDPLTGWTRISREVSDSAASANSLRNRKATESPTRTASMARPDRRALPESSPGVAGGEVRHAA